MLLIGEYTVTAGFDALAIPYGGYSGHWAMGEQKDLFSKNGLQLLRQYILTNDDLMPKFDLEQFDTDIENGLYFDSDIPYGYGLGSSGALVAAFYDKYALIKETEINELKKILGQIECAFHGSSSGIDPTVCYLNQAIKVDKHNGVEKINLDTNSLQFYLLNTGIERKTTPLVKIFKEKLANDASFSEAIDRLGHANQNAIHHIIGNDTSALKNEIKNISTLQLSFFGEMIPGQYLKLWAEGLESDDFYLKLCGAGGGGMILCYLPVTTNKNPELKNFNLLKVG